MPPRSAAVLPVAHPLIPEAASDFAPSDGHTDEYKDKESKDTVCCGVLARRQDSTSSANSRSHTSCCPINESASRETDPP
eukprot:1226850-Karenia_brevis.AAC.1